MKAYQLIFLMTIGLLTSCSPTYTYFTKGLYEQEKWVTEDLMRIQFYVSRDIVLQRAVSSGETSIAEGKIIVRNGQRIEQVVISAGTPGVLVMMPREDRFAISFEEDNEAFLMFGPNAKYEDRFALLATQWERETGDVHYRDKVYTVDAANAFASLMVDLKREGERQVETRNVKGRTVEK